MCGIAGILSTQLSPDITAQKLAVMQQHLNHRGPDGRGEYFSPSHKAALAHTRLSIIDLSESGSQPMSDSSGRYTISFNGEIYNYQELKATLIEQGVQFNSNSDTEVILALYAKLGPDFLHKLRGMFAFVIWDEVEKTAFAARDPLGIKPLYYFDNGTTLALASEIRALIAADLSLQKINARGVYSFLKTGSVSEPDTLIDDIMLLPAGHTLSWSAGISSVRPYWAIRFESSEMDLATAQRTTRNALESTVAAHFVSDVPVGIFLSGGIDSTAIVALASKINSQPLNTYSIAFQDPEWNEGDIARRVAEHFGCNHTEFVMTPEIARPLFDEFLNTVDQPTIDGFNTFCVSKLASDAGQKVVLSGLGGDELFAGYKSFETLPKMLKVSTLLKPFVLVSKVKSVVLNRVISAKLRRIFDFLLAPGSVRAAHTSLRGIFSHSEAEALCSELALETKTTLLAEPVQPTQADQISELELTTYMRNQLLRDSDVTSMAWGLELRVPFVDRELLEQVAKIPAHIRLRPGKKLLVEAVPEIPEWVVSRPKQGFRFPFDQWFADQWQGMDAISSTPRWVKLEPWYRRWALIVLNHWVARYVK